MINPEALKTLSTASKAIRVEAFLYTETENIFCFVNNPQGYKVSSSADLSAIIIPGKNRSKHLYQSTSNRIITIPGIIFDTYSAGYNLQSVIDKIESLMIPVEGSDNTPFVGFRWGLTDFYPCYLIDFQYDVELLLSGAPAKLTCSLTLEETDEKVELLSATELAAQESIILSDREQSEGLETAQSDIQNNPDIIGEYADYTRFLAGISTLEIDQSGIISKVFEEIKVTLGKYNPLDRAVIYD